MKKRIIICSDGTWNSPEEKSDGSVCITNVLRLARAISSYDSEEGIHQVAFYDAGIGAESIGPIEKKARGATGWGIRKNIADCYRFLAHNYCEQDELFLFGFSRGAYTVRLLSGLLDGIGILTKRELDHLPQILDYYRGSESKRKKKEFKAIRELTQRTVKPSIRCLGVWDTVGALGIPTPLVGALTKKWVGFRNVHLCENVERAYQALAIDERRPPFAPSVWDGRQPGQHLEQVWFAGVHSDVGGGYREKDLSLIALDWMARRSMECGLKLDTAFLEGLIPAAEAERRALGPRHDSMSPLYRVLSVWGRHVVGRLFKGEPSPSRPVGSWIDYGEMIHESVLTRLQKDPSYRPGNLITENAHPDSLLVKGEGRHLLDVHGVQVPITRERAQVRHPVSLDATLVLEADLKEPCKVLNLSERGGAMLKVANPPAPGAGGVLESEKTGRAMFRVVWSNSEYAGVRFAV